MVEKITKEIELRLRAPIIALERISKGQHLPKIFVKAALEELKRAHKIAGRLATKRKRT